MKSIHIITALVLAGLMFFSCSGKTPLDEYGQLQVIGTDLCDEDGNPVQLKGISSLDVHEYRTFVNLETMEWLRDDWDMDVFRSAMYTEGNGRNLAERKKGSVMKSVDYALEAGVYVIIDWHILGDYDPMKWLDESKVFFAEMAELYKDYPNVLYEICNEPNGPITWADNVKPYAEEVIPVIRAIDPDSIIIVGSPTWSQDVDIAARDPLEFDNIMYAAHFYAGTHGQGLMNKIETAIELGAPIFMTEWGTTKSSGHEGVYPVLTANWINFMDEHNLSWANWSLCNVIEDSAILWTSAGMRGEWLDSDITESGLLVRNIMRGGQSALFADGFENSKFLSGSWERNGVNVLREGAYAGEVSGEFLNGHSLTKAYSTSMFTDVQIEAQISTENMSSGDTFYLEWFDGSSWNVAKEWTGNTGWKRFSVDLPQEAEGLTRFKFRFRADFASADARALLDDVSLNMDLTLNSDV